MKNVPYAIAMAGLRVLVAKSEKTSSNPLERLDDCARAVLGAMLAMGVSGENPGGGFHLHL